MIAEPSKFQPVFRIRIRIQIHRIYTFLGLPDPDPLVRGMDPASDPDPSIMLCKMLWKTSIPTVLRLLLDFLSLKNDVNVTLKRNKQNFF